VMWIGKRLGRYNA